MESRLLLIFGREGDERVERQMAEIASDTDGARDRDLAFVEVDVMPQAGELYERWGVGREEFAVVLIGKDGTEKHRAGEPLPIAEVWSRIDAMPMRRRELGDADGPG